MLQREKDASGHRHSDGVVTNGPALRNTLGLAGMETGCQKLTKLNLIRARILHERSRSVSSVRRLLVTRTKDALDFATSPKAGD